MNTNHARPKKRQRLEDLPRLTPAQPGRKLQASKLKQSPPINWLGLGLSAEDLSWEPKTKAPAWEEEEQP